MILRQLATQLRHRDWLAVLVEIGIVIVGILIALQLDNWNQDREANAQADVWRNAIIEDLRATQRNLLGRISYYEQALAFAETALPGMLDSIGSKSVLTKLANYYEVAAFDVSVIAGGSPPYRDKPDLDSEILETVRDFRADPDLHDKLRGRMSQLMIVIAAFSRQVQHIEGIILGLQQTGPRKSND